MRTIHRYQKDTIRGQMWELCIIEDGDTITLHKTHLIKDNSEIVKEVSETINRKVADKYMKKNLPYHIETYRD
jgi:hypothetical protein